MLFYIGLSRLSNLAGLRGTELLHLEGRRILSRLDGNAPLPEILTEPSGRPFFADRHADFSISHSRKTAAVSWLSASGEEALSPPLPRTGCDIQYINPRKNYRGIAESFFSGQERQYIGSAQDAEDERNRFYKIWTLKECFLKMRGLTVFDIERAPSFQPGKDGGLSAAYPQHSAEEEPSEISFFLFHASGGTESYALAASLELPRTSAAPVPIQPEIRWFSSERLKLTRNEQINAVVSPVHTVRPKM